MSDCIFCKIVNGEMPAYTLYEDENTLVFLDAYPGTKGHTLVIPKKHYQDIFDTPEEVYTNILHTALKVAKMLKSALKFDGLNFFQSSGNAAGQTVFHIHAHLFPRWEGDKALGTWLPKSQKNVDLQKVKEEILSAS